MNYWMIIAGIVIVILKDNFKDTIQFLIVIVMPIVIGTVVCAFGFTLIWNGVS